MTGPDQVGNEDEVLLAARDMTHAILTLSADVREVGAYTRRSRRYIALIGMSLAFDLFLTVVLGFGLHAGNVATKQASRNASTLVVTCNALNASNKVQSNLWNSILLFPPPADETAAQKTAREEKLATFRAYIADAFKLTDCSSVNP